jgi:uncharacterized protein YfdQ (DUF2303 family)
MDVDNIGTLIEAIRAGTAPIKEIDYPGRKVIVVPGHDQFAATAIEIDAEIGLAAPVRKRGTVTVFDAASFNQVLRDNGGPAGGDCAIYMDRNPEKPRVVAVMNGNGKNGPGWGDFRCEIAFRPTPQWKKWRDLDGRLLEQVPFGEFLEENMEDIAEPAGAMLLEIATYLTVTRSVNFKSGIHLGNGTVQLQHDENDEVKAGDLKIPETFTLGIAPVYGLASYRVPARLRYRIKDRKLLLGFKLQRIETLMEKIVEDVISKIERGANISVLDGLPPF